MLIEHHTHLLQYFPLVYTANSVVYLSVKSVELAVIVVQYLKTSRFPSSRKHPWSTIYIAIEHKESGQMLSTGTCPIPVVDVTHSQRTLFLRRRELCLCPWISLLR
jgi:hypothetical protein